MEWSKNIFKFANKIITGKDDDENEESILIY